MSEPAWTTQTLKAYFDMRYSELEKAMLSANAANKEAVAAALQAAKEAVAAALSAADRAVAKAEAASEARFSSVNEFRAALTDQTATFIPRVEAEQRIGANAEKVASIERHVSGLLARPEYETAHKALEDRVAAVISRMDRNEGRSGGMAQGWVWIVGGLGALGTVVGIVVVIVNLSRSVSTAATPAASAPAPVIVIPAAPASSVAGSGTTTTSQTTTDQVPRAVP